MSFQITDNLLGKNLEISSLTKQNKQTNESIKINIPENTSYNKESFDYSQMKIINNPKIINKPKMIN